MAVNVYFNILTAGQSPVANAPVTMYLSGSIPRTYNQSEILNDGITQFTDANGSTTFNTVIDGNYIVKVKGQTTSSVWLLTVPTGSGTVTASLLTSAPSSSYSTLDTRYWLRTETVSASNAVQGQLTQFYSLIAGSDNYASLALYGSSSFTPKTLGNIGFNDVQTGIQLAYIAATTKDFGSSSNLSIVNSAYNGVGTLACNDSGSWFVNTAAPTHNATLEVNGNIFAKSFTGSFSGSVNSNAIVQGGNSFGVSASIGTNDQNILALKAVGNEAIFISSSANAAQVGIGVAAQAFPLAIGGTGQMQLTGSANRIVGANNSSSIKMCGGGPGVLTGARWELYGEGTDTGSIGGGQLQGGIYFITKRSGSVIFQTSPTVGSAGSLSTLFNINPAGNSFNGVGCVGVLNASPTASLDVTGDIRASTNITASNISASKQIQAAGVTASLFGTASAVVNDTRFITYVEPTQRIFRSTLPNVAVAITTTANVAYFVYMGRTVVPFTASYVEFAVTTQGAGSQAAEVGLFSSSAAPNKNSQILGRITQSNVIGSMTAASPPYMVRNSTAFSSSVPAGIHLWAGFHCSMSTTQPTIPGLTQDWSQGNVLTTATASNFTGSGTYTGSIVAIGATYMNTAICPDLYVVMD